MLTIVIDEKQIDIVFDALAHPVRRSIVYAVALCPRSIKSLADELGYSLPAIHKHIDALEGAQLIQRRKSGRVNYLSIQRSGVTVAKDWLMQFNSHWGNDAETLENYIQALDKESI